jgi:hypothetical protein
MRLLFIIFFAFTPLLANAQQKDSYFKDYQEYERFVDSRVMNRDFIELIQVLGGRDEYTIEQLEGINQRFLNLFPDDFTDRAVIRKTDLGEGFSQEMRVYWGEESGYNFFYAMLHTRPDGLAVLTFTLNSDVSAVLAEF